MRAGWTITFSSAMLNYLCCYTGSYRRMTKFQMTKCGWTINFLINFQTQISNYNIISEKSHTSMADLCSGLFSSDGKVVEVFIIRRISVQGGWYGQTRLLVFLAHLSPASPGLLSLSGGYWRGRWSCGRWVGVKSCSPFLGHIGKGS